MTTEIKEFDFTKETRGVNGPISTFAIDPELKAQIQAEAIQSGVIVAKTFNDCPTFSSPEQKQKREDVKRTAEILEILQADKDKTPEDVIVGQFAKKEVWTSILIESARRLSVEDNEKDEAFYRRMLEWSMKELCGAPEQPLVNHSKQLLASSIEPTKQPSEASNVYIEAYRQDYGAALEVEGDVMSAELNVERFTEIRAMLQEEFAPIFTQLREEFGEITNETTPAVLDRFVELRGLKEKGWSGVYDDKTTGFKVEPGKKQMVSGRRSAPISWAIFERLVVHEDSHAERAQRGGESGFEPLKTGLPGNVEPEEGFGLLREQIWQGKRDVALGRDHYRYLAISYAMGAVDGERHSIQETFDFTSRSMTAVALAKLENPSDETVRQTIEKNRKLAFSHVFRTFRGMPEGLVYPKDLAYLAGKIKMIDYINKSSMPSKELMDFLSSGKFNPLDEQQVELARKLWKKKV